MHASPPRKSDPPPSYADDASVGPMLRFQRSLPHLPVPTLPETLSRYLETVRPHLSAPAYAHTRSLAHSFGSSAQGKELQRRLEERAKEEGRANWLAEWWDETAYMGYREPVVPHVSYFYVHRDDPVRDGPAKRASALVKAMMPFRDMVETQQLEPDKVRGAPLCMASLKWLFNASRYPAAPSDTARKFPAAENNHVVFVRKNRFFAVDDVPGMSTAELELQINRIISLAGPTPSAPVGALTSENRDTWLAARTALLRASPSNADSLARIESAIIVVALDDAAPKSREEISWGCWAGDGRNRWFDKHQLIVFDNGRSGFLGEHSCMDGTPTLRMNEFVLASLASGKIDHGPPNPRSNLPQPAELKFELDDACRKYIADAERNFDAVMAKHDLHVLHYSAYGSRLIKSHKASPDAWAQLVMQLAWHKMFSRPGVAYESAQTRKYQLGRTEVIRSASSESKEWAEAMLDPSQTDARRAELFHRAIRRHLQYAAWAADGRGVDRHLFGLRKVVREGEEVPELFRDEAYARTSHWEMSTSQLSSAWLEGWGYGEVVEDGYGLAYAIGDDYLRWTVTSLKRDTARLRDFLAEAATETREMMERAAKAEGKVDAKL